MMNTAIQREPTPALQRGDFLMEYRTVNESGREEVAARYYLKGGSELAQLVPLTNCYDNGQLVDALKFWLEVLPSKDFELDETSRQCLLGDLLMFQTLLAASKAKPPAAMPPAV